VEGPSLTPEDTEELMRSITSEEHIQHVRERGGADYGFAFGDAARFASALSKEKGNFAMVLRQIPNKLLNHGANRHSAQRQGTALQPAGWYFVTGRPVPEKPRPPLR